MRKLQRKERLRERANVSRLFEEGLRSARGVVAIRALCNGLDISRIVAVAGKASGNAVERNRMRRRLKAAYRMQKDLLPKGWDLALVARKGLLEANWADLTRDLREAVEKAVLCACPGRRP